MAADIAYIDRPLYPSRNYCLIFKNSDFVCSLKCKVILFEGHWKTIVQSIVHSRREMLY